MTVHSTTSCSCGQELKPGEDYCYSCLGEKIPAMWDAETREERLEYIKNREADFSRVGTEEWKEEMRKLWPFGGVL